MLINRTLIDNPNKTQSVDLGTEMRTGWCDLFSSVTIKCDGAKDL